MKEIFKSFLEDKKFYTWLCLFFFLLFFIFNPVLALKDAYMEVKNITDMLYIALVFLLPMSFYEMGLTSCILLDVSYLSLVFFVVIKFINYFFNEGSSCTLTRIKRDKWIKELFKINFIFSILISILYIAFYIVLCVLHEITIDINLTLIIGIILKILITILIPNIYLLCYIIMNSPFTSLLTSIVIYVFLEIIIKFNFIEESLTFKNVWFIFIIIIGLYISIYKTTKIIFKEKDV